MFRFGKHFLANQSVLKKIAEALALQKNDVVIEIGAGHGELTSELRIANDEVRIIAIEKDGRFVSLLRKKFARDKNTEIIEGDILKLLPSIIHNSLFKIHTYKLVGNIPYYITGKLLRLLSECEDKPSRSVFMLQKEVAERLASGPPQMNRLAASVQFWAKPEIIGFVSKEDFRPRPDVDSAIIKLETRDMRHGARRTDEVNSKQYYRIVRILFQQPRKTTLNNLAENNKKTPRTLLIEKLRRIGISPNDRPQNLSIGDITKIIGFLADMRENPRTNLGVGIKSSRI